MKLQDQVITPEQAKRLKELGVKQKSLFYWHPSFESPVFGEIWTTVAGKHYQKSQVCHDKMGSASAFTVAELGQMMGSEVYTERTGTPTSEYANWDWVDNTDTGTSFGPFDTEAQARASLVIRKLENNWVTPEEVNSRLTA